MPGKWKEIFHKENDYAKAAANAAIDAHADPKILIAESIRQLQDDHAKLEHSVAVVIGEATTAKAKLEADLTKQKQLDMQGQAAVKAGHTDAAQAIAHQLETVEGLLAIEQPAYDKLAASAEQAKAAFQANSEQLAAKMQEASQLSAEVDQAAVEHNITEAMKAVNSMTSSAVPSFDSIRDRIHAQSATEEAQAQLEGSTPDLAGMNEQHLLNQAAADNIVSRWGTPATPTPPPAKHGSPMDEL